MFSYCLCIIAYYKIIVYVVENVHALMYVSEFVYLCV